VRSHAKASSAGSTERKAAGLACSFLLALLALMALAIPANAGETHIVSSSFGESGSGDGQVSLAESSGLAVNETTHDVYVADTGNHRVVQFDSAGNFIRAFGADVGGAGVDVCTTGCVAGTSGTAPGAFAAPTFIAVDNSAGASGGDVYVADTSNNVVTKFEADGTLVSSWGVGGQLNGSTAPGGPFGEIVGIAVDASGGLSVLRGGNPGQMFRFSESGAFGTEFATPRGSARIGLAVDPDGNFFKANGDLSVEKFKASGADIGRVNNSASTTGLAVDPSSGELFIDKGAAIDSYAFTPSGEVVGSGCTPAPFAGCAPTTSFGSGDLSAGAGLAFDGTSEVLYAADRGAGEILGFIATFLPSAATQAATDVENDSAILHGTLSADGGPEASCEFQYTPEATFQSEGFATATSIPCSPAGPFTGSATEVVSGQATGLDAETAYRFRIVAANEDGPKLGQALSFATAGLPLISAQSVEEVGPTDAIVSAKLNPNWAKTTYHVEYGTTNAYGQSTAESLPIGFEGDDSDHTVSVHIGGLAPGTAYHYSFVATNVAGSAEGTDTTFATYPVPPTFGPCPDDRFRIGPGAALPDCRAYEQATPIDKHGANAQGSVNLFQASGAGDRITFFTNGGLPSTGGATGLFPFMASRGPAGWSTDGLQPLTDPGFGISINVLGWSEDLSTTAVVAPGTGNVGLALYLRDSDTAAYKPGPAGPALFPSVADFAADTSHLIFEDSNNILPGAPAGKNNLYDLDHDTLTLASRIPGGSATSCDDETGPACEPAPNGAFAGPYNWTNSNLSEFGGARGAYYTQNTISRDGSRVIFTAAGSGQLYVREDGARTTRISASQRTTPDPNGEKPAAFMAATPDGSKVFFTSCEKLTDDSTAFSTAENACTSMEFGEALQGQDLYSYDVESGELTDLTVDTNAGDEKGAAVQGVLGASEDGSYVYFAANGVLRPGASPGNCTTAPGTGKSCNLYVSHDGTPTFIASVDGSLDDEDWAPRTRTTDSAVRTSRVSADGTVLLFSSVRSLTGYDNTEVTASACGNLETAGERCAQLFRYSAPEEELACISCNPAGVRPKGVAALGTIRNFVFYSLSFTFLTRNLSPDGDRVFFDSADALLPTDTNGVIDVYEWEAEGTGTCETAGGCIYLLSSGTSPDPSWFGDASLDGEHAFLFTGEQLVPGDRDQLYDVYDAGVGAGLAAQHALSPPTCTSTACQVNPPPPPDPPASSAVFSGPGNPQKRPAARKCPRGKRKVRRAGKVRCLKAPKQHKRHSNRGGSK
jgi:hypothetical protein